MIVPYYTFKIAQIDRNEREVTPYNKDMIINWNVQKGEAFFRETLKTNIKLIGADADYIIDAEYTQKFIFKIIKDSEIYYQGFFYKHDCNIDYQKRTCEFTCITDDDYVDILENYDTQYDLFKIKTGIYGSPSLLPSDSCNVRKSPILQLITYPNYNAKIFNLVKGRYCNLSGDGDDDGVLGYNTLEPKWRRIQNTGNSWGDIAINNSVPQNGDDFNLEKIKNLHFIPMYYGNEIIYTDTRGQYPIQRIFYGPETASSQEFVFDNLPGNDDELLLLSNRFKSYISGYSIQLCNFSPHLFLNPKGEIQIKIFHNDTLIYESGWDEWLECETVWSNLTANPPKKYAFLSPQKYVGKNDPDGIYSHEGITIFIRPICIYGRVLCDTVALISSTQEYDSHPLSILNSDDFANTSIMDGSANYRYYNNDILFDSDMRLSFIAYRGAEFNANRYSYGKCEDIRQYFYIPKYVPNVPSNLQLVPTSTTKLYPINQNNWANTSLWMYATKPEAYENIMSANIYAPSQSENPECSDIQLIKDSFYSLFNVIKTILFKLNPNVIFTEEDSQFLYGENLPVPRIEGNLYLTPITNILKSNHTISAKKFEVSLKEIMDMLRECFSCYWYITSSDHHFRIEHLYYFTHGNSYNNSQQPPGPSPEPPVPSPEEPPVRDIISEDVTDYIDLYNNKHILYYQSKIKFNLTDFKKKYTLEFADKSCLKMDETIISNPLKSLQEEKIAVKKFVTDTDSMFLNPKKYNPDNIVIITDTNIETVNCDIKDIEGLTYLITPSNLSLFWISLLNFRMYDMEVSHPNVEFNQVLGFVARNVYFAQDYKKGMIYSLKMPLPDNIPFNFILTNRLIKTDLGIGIIEDYSFDIFTRQATFTIKYEPNINLEK